MKPALDITFSLAERLLMVESGCGRETRKKKEIYNAITWSGLEKIQTELMIFQSKNHGFSEPNEVVYR